MSWDLILVDDGPSSWGISMFAELWSGTLVEHVCMGSRYDYLVNLTIITLLWFMRIDSAPGCLSPSLQTQYFDLSTEGKSRLLSQCLPARLPWHACMQWWGFLISVCELSKLNISCAGRMVALKLSKPPAIQTFSLAETLDDARKHNAATLALTYPETKQSPISATPDDFIIQPLVPDHQDKSAENQDTRGLSPDNFPCKEQGGNEKTPSPSGQQDDGQSHASEDSAASSSLTSQPVRPEQGYHLTVTCSWAPFLWDMSWQWVTSDSVFSWSTPIQRCSSLHWRVQLGRNPLLQGRRSYPDGGIILCCVKSASQV